MIDLLVGPVIYRILITAGDPRRIAGFPERVLELALSGLSTRPRG